MGSFLLSQEHVLYLSLAVNGLLLLHVLMCRLAELLLYLLRGRCRLSPWIAELNRIRPGLTGRVMSEQLSLWLLVLAVIVCLKHTSVSSQPFLQPRPSNIPPHYVLLRVVLAVSVARSLLLAGRLALFRDVHVLEEGAKSRTSRGPTGITKLDFAYVLSEAGAKFIYFTYDQNLFLGLISPFFELSSTTLEVYRLMEHLRKELSPRALRKTAMLNLITCVMCCIVLPPVFLILALTNESPLKMDTVPLACFFVSGACHLGYHCFTTYQSFMLVLRPPTFDLLTLPRTSKARQSGPSALDVLSNDIHDEDLSSNGKPAGGFPLFKSFNYILMRPFDNRNLSCVAGDGENEKLNVFKKKEVSKHAFLYKSKRIEENTAQTKEPHTISKSINNNQSEQEISVSDSVQHSSLEEEISRSRAGESETLHWIESQRVNTEDHCDNL